MVLFRRFAISSLLSHSLFTEATPVTDDEPNGKDDPNGGVDNGRIRSE